MKIASFVGAFVLAASVSSMAFAQKPQPQQPQKTTQTSDYTETNTGGDQVVKFTGDELAGPVGGVFGNMVIRPPGTVRVGLIRPRMNFVAELLKSVENI